MPTEKGIPMTKKVLSILMTAVLLVGLLPGRAAAEETAGSITASHSLNEAGSCITAEAYATAKTVSTRIQGSVPADIVLVLDQSGSMAQKLDGKTTRQAALQKAAEAFVNAVSASPDHRIAIVTFSSSASTLVNWQKTDDSGRLALIRGIGSLSKRPTGGTYMDLGLEKAKSLLDGRKGTTYPDASGTEQERQKLVVLFTDGYPGLLDASGDYFSTYYDTPREADDAVAAAAKLKKAGATVCTVGIFEGADPDAPYNTTRRSLAFTVWRSADKCANGLMHFISSDYDASVTAWRKYTAANDGRSNGFYLAASDTEGLVDAFTDIAREYTDGGEVLTPNETAVLREVLSEDYTVAGTPIAYTAAYDASTQSFGARKCAEDVTVTVDGNTVSVSGFDFSAAACIPGNEGRKLILEIPVKKAGTAAGRVEVTGSESGVYDASGTLLAELEPLNTVLLGDFDMGEAEPDALEKYMKSIFGNSDFYNNQWQTMKTVKQLDEHIYLMDYSFDYGLDKLLERGTDTIGDLLLFCSKQMLNGMFRFRENRMDGGCSAFTAYNPQGDHLLGRNFDYKTAPCFVVWTHPEDGYASIGIADANFMLYGNVNKPWTTVNRFQTLLAPYTCVDGMNEMGMSICVLQIHADSTNQDTGKTDLSTTVLIRTVLDKAANVEEALELFRSYDLHDPLGCCYHYMLCDAEGNSALVEYVNNEMRVLRPDAPEYDEWMADFEERNSQFAVNFFLSTDADRHDMDGGDEEHPGGNRAQRIADRLKAGGSVMTELEAMALLENVRLDYQHPKYPWRIASLWSAVYNTNQRSITLAGGMDYSSLYRLEISKPGQAVRIR